MVPPSHATNRKRLFAVVALVLSIFTAVLATKALYFVVAPFSTLDDVPKLFDIPEFRWTARVMVALGVTAYIWKLVRRDPILGAVRGRIKRFVERERSVASFVWRIALLIIVAFAQSLFLPVRVDQKQAELADLCDPTQYLHEIYGSHVIDLSRLADRSAPKVGSCENVFRDGNYFHISIDPGLVDVGPGRLDLSVEGGALRAVAFRIKDVSEPPHLNHPETLKPRQLEFEEDGKYMAQRKLRFEMNSLTKAMGHFEVFAVVEPWSNPELSITAKLSKLVGSDETFPFSFSCDAHHSPNAGHWLGRIRDWRNAIVGVCTEPDPKHAN